MFISLLRTHIGVRPRINFLGMNESLIHNVRARYSDLFESSGRESLVFSPGRINIIGEHVDYNDGKMIPAAIEQGIYSMGSQRTDDLVNLHAVDFNETVVIDVANPVGKNKVKWANYIIGVISQFQKLGIRVPGFNLVFQGDLPIGAGLSSSAAVECGTAAFLNHICRSGLSRIELIKMAQKAEHEFTGVQCGIMDQYASMTGKKGHAFLLDSFTLTHEYLSVDPDKYSFVLLDSQVKHSLATTEYNTRREECQAFIDAVKKIDSSVTSFRDMTLETLSLIKPGIDDGIYSRGKYVIGEMLRVESAARAIHTNDFEKLGKLIYQTHTGLSKDYGVSCQETDFLVEQTMDMQSVLGSRMMGGGFGGCTINLVGRTKVAEMVEAISKSYQQKFNVKLKAVSANLAAGTTLLN